MTNKKKNTPKTPKIYNHLKIEPKWRKIWTKNSLNKVKDDYKKPKFYILDMFPYPSGEGLHVGHPRGFIATDVYSRYKRMHGFNVLHPMGWDAFGLPAENHAIKNKTNPTIQTAKNVKRYKEQASIIGFNYDWDREVNTTDPKYYKWTQWIFLKLLEKGLAYESFAPINWCPSCKTGLANEDLEDGKCERCGTIVEKKPMRQWVLKITDYADRLLKDIDTLNWPESIKESQRNWIGRSEGAELDFKFFSDKTKSIKVFTTRADTLFGVTYVVLAPENSLIEELKSQIKNWSEVEKYRTEVKNKTEIERTAVGKIKTGVNLKGLSVINPATNEEVPVWVADYVLNDYGTGAVMAVPAHDERDFEFAKKYNLPIKQVIEPKFVGTTGDGAVKPELPFVKREAVCVIVRNPKNNTYLCISWKGHVMNGLVTGGIDPDENIVEAAKREIQEETGYLNLKHIDRPAITINTQFYHRVKKENRWAHFHYVFFDLINEEKQEIEEKEKSLHEVVWKRKEEMKDFFTVFEGEFVINILNEKEFVYTGDGILMDSAEFDGLDSEKAKKEITKVFGKLKVSYKLKDWVFSRQRYWGEPIPVVHCAKCGVVPVKEKDLPVTLPKVKFYEPTGTGESPLAAIDKWVNTKCPKCGGKAKRETNTMPQWAGSSWYYLRYMDPKNSKALVDKRKEQYWAPVDLYVGGTEHATRHLIYARFWHKFLYDIGAVSTKEPFRQLKNQGMILGSDNRKMSKRWGNVVNPDEVVKNVGADTLRVYEMFMGPFDQEISWSTDNMVGSRRFLERVWKLQEKVVSKSSVEIDKDFETLLHKTIKKVTEDLLSFNFNTVISAFMILINAAEKTEVRKSDYEILLKLLAPFAPHITEEIWANLGHKKSIHLEKWPEFDSKKIISDKTTVVVQINGKPRASFEITTGSSQDEVEKAAFDLPDVSKWLVGKSIKKKMFIKEKILSLITD